MRQQEHKPGPIRLRNSAALATSKAWTERVILAQSPLWISSVGLVMLTGVLRRWNDATYFLFSTTVAAPAILVPALLPTQPDRHLPLLQQYWLKLNIWVAILVAFGTYFGTHYFFDLMGMRYAFHVRWNLSSDILGRGTRQDVPLFMYPLTHAYFMTYYAALMAAEREILKRFKPGPAGRFLIVVVLAYVVAFLETYFMASSLLSGLFAYGNRSRMLKVGSFGYASYFVVGLPMVQRIDSQGEPWTVGRVVIEALATCMMVLVLLEVWAKLIGPL